MPFVPLGSRKRIEVILDGDKEAIRAKQAARDDAVIQAHVGTAPSKAGYRFANHPVTKAYSTNGVIRGPDVPFKSCHSSWKPAEVDPSGPAGKHHQTVAKTGGVHDGSHMYRNENVGLTLTRSSPTLTTTGADLMEQCHPLSQELSRWKKMAHHSIKNELNPNMEIPKNPPRVPTPEKKIRNDGGLVNFPKYMLIHNCHLKLKDLQRYQKEEEAKRLAREARDAEEAAMAAEAGDMFEGLPPSSAMGPRLGEGELEKVSWGEPRLRNAENPEEIYAGSNLPQGKSMRASNPFRQ